MDPTGVAEFLLAVIAALGLGAGAKPAYNRLRGNGGNGSVNGGPALSVLLEKKFDDDSQLMVKIAGTQERTVTALERVDSRLEALNDKQDRALSGTERIPVIEEKLTALDRIERKLP